MNALNSYQHNQVTTATPEQILIMLYDGAIRFTAKAAIALQAGNQQALGVNINKTIAILQEFAATLDHEVGGEIAADLEALYDFMIRELLKANAKDSLESLELVEGLLKDLRDGWVEAVKTVSTQAASSRSATATENRLQRPADHKPLSIAL